MYGLASSTSTTHAVKRIRCLSVKQPWAWLIVNGYKDYENRVWQTNYTGQSLIHASRIPDRNWKHILEYVKNEKGILVPENATCGAIVGITEIVGCVRDIDVDRDHANMFWFQGPYGFALKNSSAFPEPVPYSGRLKFFDVPILGPVKEQLERINHAIIR